MSSKSVINETASGGSIGAGSIAVNMDSDSRRKAGSARHDERRWNQDSKEHNEEEAKYAKMREKIAAAKKLKKDKSKMNGFKAFLLRRKVTEDFDMNDIVSRLKGADVETSGADVGVVSYGIEDDKNNVMRVTVRADQAQEFEETIAKLLADNKDNKSNGISLKGNSLAEILFNLRNRFEIITVDFPIIPKDVVYNADQASKTPMNSNKVMPESDDFSNSFDEQNDFDDEDQMSDMDNMDMDNIQNSENDSEQGIEGSANELNPDMEEGDNVEDFGMEPEPVEDEESILKQIVAMLKAQASAAEAQADAAAEEARAKQAEWSAIAADKEVRRQEDIARVEAQIQAEKKKEKEAKKYAQVARYNATHGSFNESTSFLSSALKLLEDNFDNPQALQKEKLQLQVKYKVNPTDDNETRNYKTTAYRLELAELNARINLAQLNAQYKSDQTNDQKKQPVQTNQPNQTNNLANQAPNTAAPTQGQMSTSTASGF